MALTYQNNFEYYCDYCDRSFTRKYNLQTHIENCHINTSCSCEICDYKFGSPAGLQLHLSRGHNRFSQPSPECDICGRIFTRKQNITSHMITVHLQGVGPEIRCIVCHKIFTTERNLKRHMKLLHNPGVAYPTCDACKKVFKSKHSLLAHFQAVHNGSNKLIRCNLCQKVYTNNRNLKRHTEMFHGEKAEYRCGVCPKIYTSNQSLRRHIKTTHDTDDIKTESKSFIDNIESDYDDFDDFNNEMNAVLCETCNKPFSEEQLLRRHIKQDHSFETFYQYCKSYLQRENAQQDDLQLVFKCEFCFSAFLSVYELKDHMKVHHDIEYCLSTCNVCFNKFYSKETLVEHRKICLPPPNVNSCNNCDKLFTDISSLEFHSRIFHPQSQIADSYISSTKDDPKDVCSYKCRHCDRMYYSERSLKHHIKLKHTTVETVECKYCGKLCNNKYYLASHIKIVHNNDTWSKCDYCEKRFKSKRNIRRHIEYTHMGMQRYKCIECETLFKEKRSLRKHVRTKHPNSTCFPQCHICHKRFESAKSCKIHLKLLHSFNMNTYPCDLCSVSFGSKEALKIHLGTKHLAEDEIYKCEDCNMVFKGSQKFEEHSGVCQVNFTSNPNQKLMPRCIICMKDFSTRKTLKRHIKKFHADFEVEELADYGSWKRAFAVDCEDCIKGFTNDFNVNTYNRVKHSRDSKVFKCKTCKSSFTTLEFAIQRQKAIQETKKPKMALSELCTTQMSDDEEASCSGLGSLHEYMEPESTTGDIKLEVLDLDEDIMDIKSEPRSPYDLQDLI
ncbi:Uncharacterized protein OBRU01_19814 [Operophtera brumata]|uniref:C2H2-type domain-containing protein n=1 Tax=Operophtera brumata TaxID=104452 RepID=A0A0L7KW27_OPEBR|nr:Uncharacterized protein OBRU01_19814 [Operophtera brumata]